MKCPNDKTEMEKGYLIDDGGVWVNDSGLTKRILGPILRGKKLVAWRCPKCNKIELKTE